MLRGIVGLHARERPACEAEYAGGVRSRAVLEATATAAVESGVPQGTVLDPILFSSHMSGPPVCRKVGVHDHSNHHSVKKKKSFELIFYK